MNQPKWIVIHTAAHAHGGTVYDTSATEIDNWHKQNGWNGIGYHYVIRFDGRVEKGREEYMTGAHARGLNSSSIGICFSGHGDIQMLTQHQLDTGLKLVQSLIKKYNIPIDNILGHREIGKIAGVPDPNKTCPGNLVNMDSFRKLVNCIDKLKNE